MSHLLYIGIALALLMILLLLFKKQKRKSDFLLAGWIFILLLQLTFYQVSIYQFPFSGSLAIIGFGIALLNLPIFYFYTLLLAGRTITRFSVFLHLSPFLLFCFVFITADWVYNAGFTASNGYLQIERGPQWLTLYAVPLAVSGVSYCFLCLKVLNEHQKKLSSFFSYREQIDLTWLRYLIYAVVIFTIILLILIFGATRFNFFDLNVVFAVVGVCFSLLIFFSGFLGFRQTDIFSNVHLKKDTADNPEVIDKQQTYEKSGLTANKASEYADLLKQQITEQHLYLDDTLTLRSLADKIGISSAHLSQVINQQFNRNFYDFINEYRVEAAKQKLSDTAYDHYSILGIALDSGFKSKSSFNRAFKKYTQQTPTQFRQQNSH